MSGKALNRLPYFQAFAAIYINQGLREISRGENKSSPHERGPLTETQNLCISQGQELNFVRKRTEKFKYFSKNERGGDHRSRRPTGRGYCHVRAHSDWPGASSKQARGWRPGTYRLRGNRRFAAGCTWGRLWQGDWAMALAQRAAMAFCTKAGLSNSDKTKGGCPGLYST